MRPSPIHAGFPATRLLKKVIGNEEDMTLQLLGSQNNQIRTHNILLVEDEPFVREATCALLRNAGFDVESAKDAQEALTIYEASSRPIDLLMTDMILPGRTGQQLAQELQQRSPGLAALITSGYSNLEYELEMPESRTYFLAKPYSRHTLIEKIEKILNVPRQFHVAAQAAS